MIKLFPQIIFAVAMLAIGIAALFFTEEIRSWVIKMSGEKRGVFNLIGSTQTTWSMRFGGFIAILIGLFILWMSWRNYYGQ